MTMDKQVMVIEFDGERVRATHYCSGKERSADMYNFDEESDFLYCCAYLIDEMAKPQAQIAERGFEGRVVCAVAEPNSGFTVGKVYKWENGRTANDNLEIYPKNVKVGASCATRKIMVVGANKFIVLRES
jgi:hypothetical protein